MRAGTVEGRRAGDMLTRHRVYLEEVLFRLRNRP